MFEAENIRDWRGHDVVDEHPLEHVLAGEEHLALVGEVAEEGPLGEARPARDLGDRGRVEPALGEERQGRRLQALARTGFPAGHGSSVAMTETDITV